MAIISVIGNVDLVGDRGASERLKDCMAEWYQFYGRVESMGGQ